MTQLRIIKGNWAVLTGQSSDVPPACRLLFIEVTNKAPNTHLQLKADPAGCSPTEDLGGGVCMSLNGTDQLS